MDHRLFSRLGAATVLALACALIAAAPAPARTALAELRVEGPGQTLDTGTWYVTGTERIRRSGASDSCPRRDGSITVPGPTAMGLPQSASEWNADLRQVRVRRDEAGLFVCEIGSILGRPFTDPDGFAGWSYYEDFVFGSASADQVALHDGDHILWVYSDFGSNPANTGSALQLVNVPAGATVDTFVIRVRARGFDGSSEPATGATIHGAESFAEVKGQPGRYEVTVAPGFSTLWASRGLDIRSNRATTCFRESADACPSSRGITIVGSNRGERLGATAGWDVVHARGGDDSVNIRQGGRDRVDCGAGHDRVVVNAGDHDDRISANCERVERV